MLIVIFANQIVACSEERYFRWALRKEMAMFSADLGWIDTWSMSSSCNSGWLAQPSGSYLFGEVPYRTTFAVALS